MKETMRFRYLATRGGYVLEEKSALVSSEVQLEVDITQEVHIGHYTNPVRAIPKPDTIFSGWSDGVKSNPRTDVGNKNDFPYKEIIANFEMKPRPWWERFRDWIWGRRNPITRN